MRSWYAKRSLTRSAASVSGETIPRANSTGCALVTSTAPRPPPSLAASALADAPTRNWHRYRAAGRVGFVRPVVRPSVRSSVRPSGRPSVRSFVHVRSFAHSVRPCVRSSVRRREERSGEEQHHDVTSPRGSVEDPALGRERCPPDASTGETRQLREREARRSRARGSDGALHRLDATALQKPPPPRAFATTCTGRDDPTETTTAAARLRERVPRAETRRRERGGAKHFTASTRRRRDHRNHHRSAPWRTCAACGAAPRSR